jgi:uncharacterized membrane protein YoaK (UPF0700 family)
MNRNTTTMVIAFVLGAAVGAVFAAVLGNAIWIGVGAIMGIAISLVSSGRRERP